MRKPERLNISFKGLFLKVTFEIYKAVTTPKPNSQALKGRRKKALDKTLGCELPRVATLETIKLEIKIINNVVVNQALLKLKSIKKTIGKKM